MRCLYCRNWQLSWKNDGREVSATVLAGIMLGLQDGGCHNINLVSPSHVVAQILDALAIAAERGLRLPLVYNTGGYDSPESLALLDGVVDIYMPDVKYGDSDLARKFSKVREYAEVKRAALKEMHRRSAACCWTTMDWQAWAARPPPGAAVRHRRERSRFALPCQRDLRRYLPEHHGAVSALLPPPARSRSSIAGRRGRAPLSSPAIMGRTGWTTERPFAFSLSIERANTSGRA